MHKSMRTTLLASTLKRGNHRLSGVLTFNLLGLLLLFLSSHMIFAQELDQTNVKTSEESFDMWDAINAIRARVVQRQGEAPPVEAPVVEATEEETPAVEEEVAAETTARKSTIRERVKTIWRRFRGQPEPSVPVPAKRRPIPLPRVRRARTGEIRPDPSGLVELKLIDFIALVREKNNRIIYQRYEWQISSEAVKRERSIFEPELAASFQVEKNDVPNTTQESMSLGFISNFREQNKRYNTSLTWLEPSGGRIGLEYRLSDLRNNLQAQVIDREWKDFLGVTYTHPLLKNRGVGITKAKINIAIKDREMKFQAYRQEMMKIVAVSASAYYELYMAQDKVKMRQESVRIAEKVLNTNHEWVKAGRMPKTEILEAEAGLDIRKSLQSQAKQDLVVAMNTVRSLLLASVTEATTTFVASDKLTIDEENLDFDESLRLAFKLRPEYLSSIRKTEQENIRLAFANNQRRPQLDLKASYGFNGLDVDARDTAYNIYDVADNFVASTIGIEYRMPLGKRKSTSEFQAARHRKEQALLELKAAEVLLVNNVDTEFKNVQSAREQLLHYGKAVDTKERLLEVEFRRFNAGNSNSRLLLRRENDLNQAREENLKALVNYKRAIVKLEMAEGALLQKFNSEVMETEE